MRKEIIGILLFFLLVFTLVSLVSFHPQDPSVNNATSGEAIQNLFGLVGAHLAGILIGLFGLGAFWVPILLLFLSIYFFGSRDAKSLGLAFLGGSILILTTGALLAFQREHYVVFGNRFTSGGLIGIPLQSFLARYTNSAGAFVILSLLWLVGFILMTGFSLLGFGDRCRGLAIRLNDRVKTFYLKRRERRLKAIKRNIRIKTKTTPEPEIKIKAPKPKVMKPAARPRQEVFAFMKKEGDFQLPPASFLDDPEPSKVSADDENLRMLSRLLEKKLEDFNVKGHVVAVSPGPVITTFEYAPAPGVKINKIVGLSDDLALTLRATSVRIVAPIPGKAAVGIEIPNQDREMVRFKEIVVSPTFEKNRSRLTICLGKDIIGNPMVAELEKMPHLLIAGATGAGKSVALNTMICSFLYKAAPDEVKLIMVDPKRIELTMYDGIPHLITPVVTDVKKATNALFWAVREMERRYELLSKMRVRNLARYNQKVARAALKKEKSKDDTPEETPPKPLPLIVIIIDELADLMMVASRDVEVALTRLAQMARAAGIHLILATQRPSVDVLTGIIKANFPTRLSFQVSSKTDSRTILDANGAETLLGKGDMLFMPPGAGKLQRIHGAYISETEINRITEFLKAQGRPDYDEAVTETAPAEAGDSEETEYDERYDDAVALVTRKGQASISMVQRHLRIGYNRAARIIETMEREGIVSPADGAKPREVLVRNYDDMG
ncbi:MAG: DNA translocase FtsK 4TM domain-containing protein [Desulfosarcina sp.]|nr:DNA translocase FtsK 4TM domain-containing protein [Desulfobacterales bacterium]